MGRFASKQWRTALFSWQRAEAAICDLVPKTSLFWPCAHDSAWRFKLAILNTSPIDSFCALMAALYFAV